jgi:isopentenyl-diphosphate Delta-isomerase
MTDSETQAPIPAWVDGVLVSADKLAVHRQGLRHQAVSVFVTDGKNILLQQRAMTKYHTPGLWANTCCTHPHWGEPPQDCAIRRLHDELGIAGLRPQWMTQVEYRAEVGNDMTEHEVVDIFVANADTSLKLRANPAEVMAVRWAGIADLQAEIAESPEIFTPWFRIYLHEYHDKIFGRGTITAG